MAGGELASLGLQWDPGEGEDECQRYLMETILSKQGKEGSWDRS